MLLFTVSKVKRILIRFVLRMKIHWIFRVVSLFNYQCALCAALASDFVSLTHSQFFVKHFFHIFKKDFYKLAASNYLNCSNFSLIWSSFVILPQGLWFVNTFLKDFFNCCWRRFLHCFVESEVHSSTLTAFCQHLFWKIF